MPTTKDVLFFTDEQGVRRHVKNLDTKRARRYVDILGCGRNAGAMSSLCFRPDGQSREMTEKELLAYIRENFS